MVPVVIDIAALIIGASLGFYFAVISVQGVGVVLHGLLTRRLPNGEAVSALCENLGVVCALIGLTFQSTDLAIVGILVIALGVVSGPGPSSPIYSVIERALLIAAMVSLGALAIVFSIG